MGGMGLRLNPWRRPIFTRGQCLAEHCEKLSLAKQPAQARLALLGLAPGAWQLPLLGRPLRLQPSHRLLMALLHPVLGRPHPEKGAGDVD